MNKVIMPCVSCDPNYPEKSGILQGRDELWTRGFHTHKTGTGSHTVFKGDTGEEFEKLLYGIPTFPWEEGYEAYWDKEAVSRFSLPEKLIKKMIRGKR